ncbi:MAG: phosphoribosylamine--glycine ligase [bacterium]
MNVLLIGSGGREHALAWKLKQSPLLGRLFSAPGSEALSVLSEPLDVDVDNHAALVDACRLRGVELVVVGPEGPLAAGLADNLRKAGIPVFGPGKDGARLEASKDFAKRFMQAHGVATARARAFTKRDEAQAYAATLGLPVVVKADGLAGGKGVTVCGTRTVLDEALFSCLEAKAYGAAGSTVLVEEFMAGEEVSLLCFCDGKTLRPMASAQDHKRLGDGDSGPNTGGMGAYSPAPVLDAAGLNLVWERILAPTLSGLVAEGLDFRGCLYVGLMMTTEGPKVVEYNVRFGDPETQVVVPRMDFDLLAVLQACAEGRLADQRPLAWKKGACATVVWAGHGYPFGASKGERIEGLDRAAALPDSLVFHAGTAKQGADWVTQGGRILDVTGWGPNLRGALDRAYACGKEIQFKGMHYRRDIGHRALTRGRTSVPEGGANED